MYYEPFENLFVLELANNHWGKLNRGLNIVHEFAQVVRFNNVKAAIKLQLRDIPSFIHKDFIERTDIRYIKKTLDTKLTKEEFKVLVETIRGSGCLPSATPFDEASVAFCEELNLPFIKIASSDVNDWALIERIAETCIPVIASTGGASLKDIDDLVNFFTHRNIPLAINHCVSLYPTEDCELELNQIDFFKSRYPDITIGLSTHEYHDWSSSMLIAYAKGARMFERHIDIEESGIPVSPYCSLADQIDTWFKAYNKAKEMCGGCKTTRRIVPDREIKYLDSLVRGVYAKRDLNKDHELQQDNFYNDIYLAIPLQKGQISCRELMSGEVLSKPIAKDAPITIDAISGPYTNKLKNVLEMRGI